MGREKKLTNDDAHDQLTHMLNEHGKKEELRELLLTQLNETGWRDQVHQYFRFFGKKNCQYRDHRAETGLK